MNRETLPKNVRRKAANAVVTRGIHHLALNIYDLRMTALFYARIGGVPLVHAMKVPAGLGTGLANRGNPPYERIRHYFFDMGNDSLLAFFEIPRGAEQAVKRNAIGGMQHVAFAVTPSQFAALQERLRAAKVAFDGPIDILPGLVSVYFLDPNGIRLEACCQPAAGEQPTVIESVAQSRASAKSELESIDRDWGTKTSGAGRFK